jgi:hypothetical protein
MGFFDISRCYAELGCLSAIVHLPPLNLRHRAKFHTESSIGAKVRYR